MLPCAQSVVGIDPELSRGELAVRLLRPVAVLCALHLYRFGFAGALRPHSSRRLDGNTSVCIDDDTTALGIAAVGADSVSDVRVRCLMD